MSRERFLSRSIGSACPPFGSSSLLCCLCFASFTPVAFGGLEWPGCTQAVLGSFPGGWPTSLDWGLYWYAADGHAEKAMPGYVPHFYDAANDTVIFFHGWLGDGKGSTPFCYRPTPFCDPDVCPETTNMFKAWFDRGWNVGFFYWDQFADEPCSRDAEQKIWFDIGGRGARWASYDLQSGQKTYPTFDAAKNSSVSDLCAATIKGALGSFSGRSLRFVGHAIGAQLAASCGQKLHAAGASERPTRLTMLDPLFTEHHMNMLHCSSSSLGSGVEDFAMKETSNIVRSLLSKGVPTETYKSSMFSEDKYATSDKLQQVALEVQYMPDWCNDEYSKIFRAQQNSACRHKAAVLTYFASKMFPPPLLSSTSGIYAMPGACVTPSAACQDGELVAMAKAQEGALLVNSGSSKAGLWVQVEGMNTMQLQDDRYAFDSWEKSAIAAKAMASAVAPSVNAPDVASVLDPSSTAKSGGLVGSSASGGGARDTDEQDGGILGTIKSRWKHMPGVVKVVVVLLGTVGLLMLCYGLQPVFARCCCSARTYRTNTRDSDPEWLDSGEEFEDWSER